MQQVRQNSSTRCVMQCMYVSSGTDDLACTLLKSDQCMMKLSKEILGKRVQVRQSYHPRL